MDSVKSNEEAWDRLNRAMMDFKEYLESKRFKNLCRVRETVTNENVAQKCEDSGSEMDQELEDNNNGVLACLTQTEALPRMGGVTSILEETKMKLLKKQRAGASTVENNKSEVKSEHDRPQIWSKENVEQAMRMKGIVFKRMSHRPLKEKHRPSEPTEMELHKSPLWVCKGHYHRCSIGGGVTNKRAASNRRQQKQFATVRPPRSCFLTEAETVSSCQNHAGNKNPKPPWSKNKNDDKQKLVVWGSKGAVKRMRWKIRFSWLPPSTSRPPDAVTTARERPNRQTFPLAQMGVREVRREDGEGCENVVMDHVLRIGSCAKFCVGHHFNLNGPGPKYFR